MQVEVIRPIQSGAGTIIPAGTIVDASAWPTHRLTQLVEQRYVVPAPIMTERTRRSKGSEA